MRQINILNAINMERELMRIKLHCWSYGSLASNMHWECRRYQEKIKDDGCRAQIGL